MNSNARSTMFAVLLNVYHFDWIIEIKWWNDSTIHTQYQTVRVIYVWSVITFIHMPQANHSMMHGKSIWTHMNTWHSHSIDPRNILLTLWYSFVCICAIRYKRRHQEASGRKMIHIRCHKYFYAHWIHLIQFLSYFSLSLTHFDCPFFRTNFDIVQMRESTERSVPENNDNNNKFERCALHNGK